MQPPAVSFSHLGIYVRDLGAMEDFYTRVMGFFVTDRGEMNAPGGRVGIVFLSRDPTEHHQLVLASGRPLEPHFDVVNQVSFRVDGLPALRHFHRTLQGEEVTEILPICHGNAISMYFRDPEGHRVELYFDTPWYCAQPCREPLDLSESDDAILSFAQRLASGLPGYKPREQWVAEMRQRMASSA